MARLVLRRGTLFGASRSSWITESAYLARRVNFNPQKGFAPVSLMADGTSMLGVHASIPARTVRDFVAYAKSQSGRLSYASGSGSGTLAPVTGQVQAFLTNVLALLPHTKSGKVNGLAVTGNKRMKAAPGIPTFGEAGSPTVDVSLWQGLFAPAGTPRDIIAKLSSNIAAQVQAPEVTKLLEAQGAERVGSTPKEFGRFVHKERERWLEVVRDAKIAAN